MRLWFLPNVANKHKKESQTGWEKEPHTKGELGCALSVSTLEEGLFASSCTEAMWKTNGEEPDPALLIPLLTALSSLSVTSMGPHESGPQ